jgi:branched-chain amino acid transport system permease protein
VINHSTWISGGAQATIYTPTPTLFGWQINNEFRRFYMILPVAVMAYVGALNLVRSRVGRAFVAVRDRDVAAEIIGVNIFRYKLLAFAVSSFYAGVAGALWTYYLKIANYEHFTLGTSVQYLAMIIIGGLGSVLGSVFGAVFITLLPIVLVYVVEGAARLVGFQYAAIADILANLRLIIFGSLIILFLAIEPEGLYRLWGNIRRYFRLWPFSY